MACGQVLPWPKYVSTGRVRHFQHLSPLYVHLAGLFGDNLNPLQVEHAVEERRAGFTQVRFCACVRFLVGLTENRRRQDGNVGLAECCVRAAREESLRRLGKVYSAVPLALVMQTVQLPSLDAAMSFVTAAVRLGFR